MKKNTCEDTVEINGFSVEVFDVEYTAPEPMVVTGSGFGDCIAPVDEEIFFEARYPTGELVGDYYILDMIEQELLQRARSKSDDY